MSRQSYQQDDEPVTSGGRGSSAEQDRKERHPLVLPLLSRIVRMLPASLNSWYRVLEAVVTADARSKGSEIVSAADKRRTKTTASCIPALQAVLWSALNTNQILSLGQPVDIPTESNLFFACIRRAGSAKTTTQDHGPLDAVLVFRCLFFQPPQEHSGIYGRIFAETGLPNGLFSALGQGEEEYGEAEDGGGNDSSSPRLPMSPWNMIGPVGAFPSLAKSILDHDVGLRTENILACRPYSTSRTQHELRWLLILVAAILESHLAPHLITRTVTQSSSVDPVDEWKDTYGLSGHRRALGILYQLLVSSSPRSTGGAATVRPILCGIPYDYGPHVSPDFDKIIYRNLGNRVEGCENELDGKKYQILSRALRFQHEDVAFLAQGIKETTERRNSRLPTGLQTRRIGGFSGTRFHLSTKKIIATNWYTCRWSFAAQERTENIPYLRLAMT
ncbi:hypothetical protein EDD18DRAFT_1109259 [Armillaria luteobubalina]|uniref:Uncharacterized protein n=1 Tax=Armillaria luteobubalina TaxID=153913 RepID=A0AA39UKW9_9AGAR|nr:hypothetical protein EDD18DRAFT_1109259 [Armillaria luteobubalina]